MTSVVTYGATRSLCIFFLSKVAFEAPSKWTLASDMMSAAQCSWGFQRCSHILLRTDLIVVFLLFLDYCKETTFWCSNQLLARSTTRYIFILCVWKKLDYIQLSVKMIIMSDPCRVSYTLKLTFCPCLQSNPLCIYSTCISALIYWLSTCFVSQFGVCCCGLSLFQDKDISLESQFNLHQWGFF